MPVFEDWLKDPLSIINNIFASDAVNFEQKIQEYFETKFKNEKNYNSIPCLNDTQLHELTPNCLVRFRCMIQDSFDPIYYPSIQRLKHKVTGDVVSMTLKYKETIDNFDDYELYGNSFEDSLTTKSNKTIKNEENSSLEAKNQNNLSQRITFYCIPIPGENEWVTNYYKLNNSLELSSNLVGSTSNNLHRPIKRGIESTGDIELSRTVNDEMNSLDCISKKTKHEENESNSNSKNSTTNFNEFNLNFPLPSNDSNTNKIASLVKIYDNFDQFKINDLYEFVGILSQDPSLAYSYDEHSDSSRFENNYHQIIEQFNLNINNEENPMETVEDSNDVKTTDVKSKNTISIFPPSLVPRLHCIKAFNLRHNNPLLQFAKKDNKKSETDETLNFGSSQNEEPNKYWEKKYKSFLINFYNESNCQVPKLDAALIDDSQIYLVKLRKEIINFFQELLLGDNLAAEYLLMHMLSSVFMRKDVTILGKFSLNITHIPQTSSQSSNPADKINFATCFYNAYKQFTTMSHLFSMTIDSLNTSNLIPNKDYNKDKLIAGVLQLPNKFHFVIDETLLNSGELNQKGLMNFNSIKDIIKWQKMNYDFSYHQQEFQTDIRVLILSQTKSILPVDCQLKLNANVEKFEQEKYDNFVNDMFNNTGIQLLNKMRQYLTILCNLDYKLNQTIQKIVEEDIVQIRQNHVASGLSANRKEKLCVDDFHLLLVVARLQTLSYGKNELGLNEWNRAKSLEFERLNNRV